MQEKNEKKTIKCSYAVLVIALCATVAFLTDYIVIDRKMNKCNCPKCEATNNKVISDNTDNTQVTENDGNNIIVSDENNYDYPIIFTKKEYSDDMTKLESYISINGNDIKLEGEQAGLGLMTIFKGLVIYKEDFVGNSNLVIADSDGKIIRKVTHTDLNSRIKSFYIKDNSIYIVSDKLGYDSGTVCNAYNNGDNKEISFVYKIDYLGDQIFSDINKYSSQTVNEFVESNENMKEECNHIGTGM